MYERPMTLLNISYTLARGPLNLEEPGIKPKDKSCIGNAVSPGVYFYGNIVISELLACFKANHTWL